MSIIFCSTIICVSIIICICNVLDKIIEHKHNERMRELAIDAERVKVEMEKIKRGVKND